MKPSILWGTAVVAFCVGMCLLVLPGQAAEAGVQFGDVNFNFGQLCLLLAVAAAWGDMRATHKAHVIETGRRLDRIEKHVFDE